jgi:hypothetical protein
MGAIVVGLRPGDHKRLKELAELQGRPPGEVAGIYLEQAIRQANEAMPALPIEEKRITTGSPDRKVPA